MTYDFNQVTPLVNLTPNWILSRVSDAQIFYNYHGRFKLGVACKSSLDKDEKPSVTFFVGDSGRLIYWDFRYDRGLDCFAYIMKLNNCSFKRALEIIAEDFGLIDKKTLCVSDTVMKEASELDLDVKKRTLIQFTTKPWETGLGKNLAFWNMYEIDQEELEKEHIYPVDRLFLNKQEITNTVGHLRFAKVEQYSGGKGVKIYSPFDSKMKWLSSIPLNVPFGYEDLQYESNEIIITKSFKDLIILKKLFSDVIACQNESEAALPADIISTLDRRFDRKLIIFDNDETGLSSASKFRDKGFNTFAIPETFRARFGIKDPSDFVKIYGLEAFKELLKKENLL